MYALINRIICIDHIACIDRITCMLTSITSMYRSHHMDSRMDRITCMLSSIASHVCSHRPRQKRLELNQLFSRKVTERCSLTTLRGSKTHCTQRTAFHVLNVLGYANHAVLHPVWTQEVKKVRPYLPTHSRTSDTTLRAPTATHMLHIHEQQLLIRHSHYRPHSSIGK